MKFIKCVKESKQHQELCTNEDLLQGDVFFKVQWCSCYDEKKRVYFLYPNKSHLSSPPF